MKATERNAYCSSQSECPRRVSNSLHAYFRLQATPDLHQRDVSVKKSYQLCNADMRSETNDPTAAPHPPPPAPFYSASNGETQEMRNTVSHKLVISSLSLGLSDTSQRFGCVTHEKLTMTSGRQRMACPARAASGYCC